MCWQAHERRNRGHYSTRFEGGTGLIGASKDQSRWTPVAFAEKACPSWIYNFVVYMHALGLVAPRKTPPHFQHHLPSRANRLFVRVIIITKQAPNVICTYSRTSQQAEPSASTARTGRA